MTLPADCAVMRTFCCVLLALAQPASALQARAPSSPLAHRSMVAAKRSALRMHLPVPYSSLCVTSLCSIASSAGADAETVNVWLLATGAAVLGTALLPPLLHGALQGLRCQRAARAIPKRPRHREVRLGRAVEGRGLRRLAGRVDHLADQPLADGAAERVPRAPAHRRREAHAIVEGEHRRDEGEHESGHRVVTLGAHHDGTMVG